MAVTIGSLLIRLGLDSGEFKSGLTASEREFRKTVKGFERQGRGLADLGRKMSVAITAPVVALGTLAVKGFVDQQRAVAQVEAALRSMGNVSGKTSAELQKTADALELRSLFDADVILRDVTANLLTFGNVAGTVFDRAQQAAVDMAQRLQSGPKEAAIQLGKALNDPIKGLTALSRTGIQFDASQTKLIKSLVQTGQVAKAQTVILDELERQFRGSAEAAADASPWRRAVVQINQAMDQIGEAILPTVKVVAETVAGMARSFSALSEPMQRAIIITAGLAAVVGPLLIVLGQTVTLLAPAAAAFKVFGASVLGSAATAGSAVPALVGVRAAILALTASLAPYLIVIGVVAAAVLILSQRHDEAAAASKTYATAQQQANETSERAAGIVNGLATAQGELREELLQTARRERDAIKIRLQHARAALILAQAEIRLKEARRDERNRALPALSASTNLFFGPSKTDLANAAAARETMNGLIKSVAELDAAINAPPPSVSGGGGTVDVETGGGGKKARDTGPTAAEIQARFVDELDSLRSQAAGAAAQNAANAQERAEFEMRGVELARRATIRQIQSDEDYSDAQKARLIGLVEVIAIEEARAVALREQAEIESEAADMAGVRFDTARELLNGDLALADTQEERKRIALDILRLEQEFRRNQLEMVLASAVASDAEKRRAQAILDSLAAVEAAETATAQRANETDRERFLRDLNKTPGQINESLDAIKIGGLDALNRGLIDAIVNFRSLGDVATSILRQITAELVNLAIQQLLIKPLAGALLGGGGGSPINLLAGTPFGGGKAAGGPVRQGEFYLVGERGPELFAPRGSGQIIPNGAMRGGGGGSGRSFSQTVNINAPMPRQQAKETGGQIARRFRQEMNGPFRRGGR